MSRKHIRIIHTRSNTLLADGPVGWGIMPFEGNYYISKKNLKSNGFRVNYVPGFCAYKFFYVWLDFITTDGVINKNVGWKYWLPNPLLPFIWFRVAVPAVDSEIHIEEYFSDN